MTAEIITIGDEILIGQIVDTNSAWLGEKLGDIGVRIMRITSVSDTASEITNAVETAMERTDLVIITGGLGPTKDDITKLTLAKFFDSKLVVDKSVLEFLVSYLGKRGIDVNELNHDQALVPDRCKVIPNHNGTAPGMWFEQTGKVVMSLPGVPFEMKAIMQEYGFEMIGKFFGIEHITHETVLTFGLPESILAEQLETWENNLPKEIKLAYLPNPNGVKLRLSCYNGKYDSYHIKHLFAEAKSIIHSAFLGYMPTSVEEEVARLLCAKNIKLSVAESCTGGYIASKFTANAGASDYFNGGVVAYSNDVKISLLGVDSGVIAQFGAVSREVAEQMAEGARRSMKSDYAIATTGIAGPSGGSTEKPVGLVWMAVATPNGVFSRKMIFGNLREQNILRATSHAINMLRLNLLGESLDKYSDSMV